ncbi:MAG: phage tail protein [Clostridia bacterium]
MAYPFKKYNYKVEIDGITEASFSEVSGFDASVDVIEYRTGDEGVNWSRKMNGLTKFGNVTLKWGMTSSLSFYDWVTSISQGTSWARITTRT